MPSLKVSVIVPCYNHAQFLPAALDSVLQQTYPHWECIVVNDGSTDSSSEIGHRYAARDARIRCIDQDNEGVSAARNTALDVATGELVNLLDADDLLQPTMLDRMVLRLGEDRSLAAAYCQWILSDPLVTNLSWVCAEKTEGQLFHDLAHRNLFPCHSVVFRRWYIDSVGRFDTTLKSCEDWDLWLRIARTGAGFACVQEPLIVYRMTPLSQIRNPHTLFDGGVEVIRRGHRSDQRANGSALDYSAGCACDMRPAIKQFALFNVFLAIAQGDNAAACRLYASTLGTADFEVTPEKIAFLLWTLYFGTATPWGDWRSLSQRAGGPLLHFLASQEERMSAPRLTLRALAHILALHEVAPPPLVVPTIEVRPVLEWSSGRDLLHAVWKRLRRRFASFVIDPKTD